MTGTLILLRHGESTANADGIFTGWTDAPLTPTGHEQANDAAHLMAAADLLPDVVHTSLLRRTITTADIVLDVLDRPWIPVTRSWRLNERHYGALTGLTKTQVSERTDEATYHAWRRSWATPPPAALPGALTPWNDDRYRSLPPDAWPLTESLADVHARLLPYWADRICTDLTANRTTLVVAHGNSLRALVTHLDQLTTPEVEILNIPTGQPLRYDLDKGLRPKATGGTYLNPRAAAQQAAAVGRQ
ncbi:MULTISPECIES: 2,3-bisphosphoglycerate-dependent phosphoglycerate mutase [unclassified Streptomyces]|uniref:2,3-bisphosphoglycerate-dependent phosphoglycerate mutase n=1 Tax=unclassified Streptomyces TaxID=2593676 RepID=UPI0034105B8F